jgi:hypothetical protein
MYSLGSYQGLLRAGLSDEEIGAAGFESEVDDGYAEAAFPRELSFCWRARVGIRLCRRFDPAAGHTPTLGSVQPVRWGTQQ